MTLEIHGLALMKRVAAHIEAGRFCDADALLATALDVLEARDAAESWMDDERQLVMAHIEQGYQQAEAGELIEASKAQGEIAQLKDQWRHERRTR